MHVVIFEFDALARQRVERRCLEQVFVVLVVVANVFVAPVIDEPACERDEMKSSC